LERNGRRNNVTKNGTGGHQQGTRREQANGKSFQNAERTAVTKGGQKKRGGEHRLPRKKC